MHPWDWTQGNMEDLSDIFRGLAQGALAYWVSAFLNYKICGGGQIT